MPSTKVEEDNNQETPDASTTNSIVKLLSFLWIEDDRTAIEIAFTGLADLCLDDSTDLLLHANEREIRRLLGGHMTVVQVVMKHVDDALIQEERIQALLNLAYTTLAKVRVGDIGGLQVILG
jgi:hypothetical protein